jgi:hypothetical protein
VFRHNPVIIMESAGLPVRAISSATAEAEIPSQPRPDYQHSSDIGVFAQTYESIHSLFMISPQLATAMLVRQCYSLRDLGSNIKSHSSGTNRGRYYS